jgi:N-acetylglucosaminyldiphosphoundecaprenol N-acetyl-beta-D-mannosaminyltransferase
MLQKRINLFGVDIDDISLDRATFLAYKSIRGGKRRSFFTPNLEMLSGALGDEKLLQALNSASVSLPDGYSLKIVAKILGKEIKNTVPGIDFGERLLELCEKEGARVFLLGGKRGVASRAAKSIVRKHPEIKICGTFHGYFKSCDVAAVCRMIEKSRADALIVCRGFPKQELFALQAMKKLDRLKVVTCLGGAFDVWAESSRRAPTCVRNMHLEWMWRIMEEPSRCFRLVSSLDVMIKAMDARFEKIIDLGINRINRTYN